MPEANRIVDYLAEKDPLPVRGPIEGQKRFVTRLMSAQRPCPNCGTPQSFLEAAKIHLTETYDAIENYRSPSGSHDECQCIRCGRTIIHTVPIVSIQGWVWTLKPIELPECGGATEVVPPGGENR